MISRISALESKKWSNQKDKGILLEVHSRPELMSFMHNPLSYEFEFLTLPSAVQHSVGKGCVPQLVSVADYAPK